MPIYIYFIIFTFGVLVSLIFGKTVRDSSIFSKLFSALFILTGFSGVLIFSYLKIHISTNDELIITVYETFIAIFVGFVTAGFLAIIIDMASWKRYFEDRLSMVLKDKKFLSTLKNDEIKILLREAYGFFLKVSGKEKESFFEYYENHIQNAISQEQRRDIVYSVKLNEDLVNNKLIIEQTNAFTFGSDNQAIGNYYCMKSSKEDKFRFKENCLVLVKPTKFKNGMKMPDFLLQNGPDDDGFYELTSKDKKFMLLNEKDINLSIDELFNVIEKKEFDEKTPIYGFFADLREFQKLCESLSVKVTVTYESSLKEYLSWTMSTLTHGLTFSVVYPDKYRLKVDYFGFSQSNFQEVVDSNGCYCKKYDSWLLPNSGIAIQLLDKG